MKIVDEIQQLVRERSQKINYEVILHYISYIHIEIIDPSITFLKYRKMITYAIYQKISFFQKNFSFFLCCQLGKDLILIWVGGSFTPCALGPVEILLLVETFNSNYSWIKLYMYKNILSSPE